MKLLRALGLAALAGTALSSCQIGYIARQGLGQWSVLWRSRPVESALTDPSLSEAAKAKLRLVEEIVLFGEQEIGLVRNANYTSYLDTAGQPVSYNIFACAKTSFTPVIWRFPIIGGISYLGFFDLEEAREERRRLEKDGFDVYLGSVAAYSTLGWFRDPILSSMLELDEIQLARLLLHEMVHATIYRPGESAFNESFAEMVSEKATAIYLDRRYGPESDALAEFRARLVQEEAFAEWIDSLREELEALYESDLEESEKLARREPIFERAKAKLGHSINNAYLLALNTYRADPALFDRAFRECGGGHLRRTLACFREIPRNADALEWMQRQFP